MPPVVRDTLSLRPQGFYGYAFIMARLAQVVVIAVVMGLTGHLMANVSRDPPKPPGSLIAILVLTSAALLWTLFSWTGYSRRYLPYMTTLSADLLFLIPFVVITIILGLPLADANCAVVAPNRRFEVSSPAFGKIAFPQDGRAACFKLFTAWGLLIAACALFVVSALSVAFLHLGERQLRKAVFAVREEPSRADVGLYGQGVNGSRARGFVPTPTSHPGLARNVTRDERLVVNDFNNSPTPSRPSIADDRLDLNRPITMAPPRGSRRPVEGGLVYEEQLGQPAAARMPRARPDGGLGQPGYLR